MVSYFDLFELLLVSQLINGFALGLACSYLTPFIDEISNEEESKYLHTLVPVAIETGATLANVSGIDVILGSKDRWPFVFVIPLILHVIR